MNRPSRTEDDLEHPTWNQNPPFLAPDLTTRQDLNGIANAREYRLGCSGPRDGAGFLNGDKQAGDIRRCDRDCDCHSTARSLSAMSGQQDCPLIAPKTVFGGEGQTCLPSCPIRPPSGWVGWIASVVAVSTLIHVAGEFGPALFSRAIVEVPDAVEIAIPRSLVARQDACAGNTTGADYNTPLHVGALLIILAVSSLACAIPLLAAKFPVLRIPEPFLFGVRHFGTGVLLATAFVHLLPTAFVSLGDSCLSSFWTTDYPAMPGAIALVGIFFVSIIEMIFSPARSYAPRASAASADEVAVAGADAAASGPQGPATHPSLGGGRRCSSAAVAAVVSRPSNTRQASIEPAPLRESAAAGEQPNSSKETLEIESQAGWSLTREQLHKKSILQCMLLEVGILFHSVFIGMALSVAVGANFVVLLIAIAFHQTFEGLALGARIASITWPKKTLQPWLMVLAYGCTTPIGQAIGLATHTLYSPDSEFGLILVGTMNAVSSGLLVFAALIELLAEDFLSDQSWSVLRGRKRVVACFLVLLGAVCMSLVGAWA
ncbi:ZIP zinc transporter-domain-containing protein [Corynascus similis CBS 632.67]